MQSLEERQVDGWLHGPSDRHSLCDFLSNRSHRGMLMGWIIGGGGHWRGKLWDRIEGGGSFSPRLQSACQAEVQSQERA